MALWTAGGATPDRHQLLLIPYPFTTRRHLPRKPSPKRYVDLRLQGYDYTRPGAYFVTTVTHQRKKILSVVFQGQTQLTPIGQIVYEEWFKTAAIRPNVLLYEDEFVIMPDHIHGIIWITKQLLAAKPRPREQNGKHNVPRPGSLGVMVGQFKSRSSRRINILRGKTGIPVWQTDYYEHIIRNEFELERIRNYIQNNPLNWENSR